MNENSLPTACLLVDARDNPIFCRGFITESSAFENKNMPEVEQVNPSGSEGIAKPCDGLRNL